MAGDAYLDLMNQYPGQDLLALSLVRDFYLVTNPSLLSDVFTHRSYDFIKPPKIVAFLKPLLGEGLIVVEGDRHKFLRKSSSPAFTFRNIKNLYPMMWDKAVALTAAIRDEVDQAGGAMELRTWTSKATLDIIGIAGLGRNFDTLRNAEDPLFKAYEQLLQPSRGKVAHAILSMVLGMRLVSRLPWSQSRKFNSLTGTLGDICRALIREKREGIEKKADDHFDVLSLLIKSGNFLDGELTDQLLTFLAAGYVVPA
jgi:cytochrome P450